MPSAEKPLALAQNDRRDHQREFVGLSGLEQLRVKGAAALDDEIGAVALLHLRKAVFECNDALAVLPLSGPS